MSTSLVHRPWAVLADAAGTSPAALAGRAWRALQAWQRRDAMRRHLQRLDDRLLEDMGITRADVMAEVAKPFWRD